MTPLVSSKPPIATAVLSGPVIPGNRVTRVHKRLEYRCFSTQTHLVAVNEMAKIAGAGSNHVKVESRRLYLGLIQGLGATCVTTHDATESSIGRQTYAFASRRNHRSLNAERVVVFGAKTLGPSSTLYFLTIHNEKGNA
jgi:hypothetical protein